MDISKVTNEEKAGKYLDFRIGKLSKAIENGEDNILARIKNLDSEFVMLNNKFHFNSDSQCKEKILQLIGYSESHGTERIEIWKYLRENGLDPDDIEGFTRNDIYKNPNPQDL